MMKELGREGNSSDDEEDDRRNLINQNDTVKPTFQIDDNGFGASPRRRFKLDLCKFMKKRYLFSVILIPLLVLLYFSIDFHGNSSDWSVGLIKSSSDQIREAELRALYLLKKQQLGLVNLLNHTFRSNVTFNNSRSNDNGGDDNSTSGYLNLSGMQVEKAGFEDLKGRIFDGLMLNKEIQLVLLSTHKNGNGNGNVSELGVENDDLMDGGFSICGKMDQKLAERRTIEWNPKKDKYLFAICVSGQMSNHLICLEKHMFFAAVLGRVLVIPSHKVDYELN